MILMSKYEISDDHEWSDEKQSNNDDTSPRTTTEAVNVDVIHVHDPSEDMGYGRRKYTARLTHDDEDGLYVLHVIQHRWKGNYWRDVKDLDWRDTPEVVRREVADALSMSVDELDCGARLVNEGGEKREF